MALQEFTFDNLTNLMREVFNAPKAQIEPSSTSASVPGWDSIAHVILMLEINDRFGIEMSPEETAEYANVGDFYAGLQKRQTGEPL